MLRVLYLIFNEGYSGDVDLSRRRSGWPVGSTAMPDHPEVAGLLALMVLHQHAARPARTPEAHWFRSGPGPVRSGTPGLIAEGIGILQSALAAGPAR